MGRHDRGEYVDVLARRDGQTIHAEAKGHTTSPGLDVDTMYGQLLRRVRPQDGSGVRYAVVVPQTVRAAEPGGRRRSERDSVSTCTSSTSTAGRTCTAPPR